MKTSAILMFIGLMTIFFGTTFEVPTTGDGFQLGITISLVGLAIAGIGFLINRLIAHANRNDPRSDF